MLTKKGMLPILFGLFTSVVVMTNAMSALLIEVGPFLFVAGTLLYPFTFLLTDVISEIYGAKEANKAVWTGFMAQALAIAAIHWVALWPTVDPTVAAAWEAVFLPLWRIAVASMVAYLIAQLIDVRVYHWLKHKTDGRHLWLRNNASTVISQFIDTIIFVLVAFAGVIPVDGIIAMIGGQWAAKTIMAGLDTPLCYMAVWAAKKLPAGGNNE